MKIPVVKPDGSDTLSDEMKVAYSYTRFSTPEQKLGRSLGRQTTGAEQWCRTNGYTLSPDTFSDEGVSAFKGKNKDEGELRRFLSLVESGKIRAGSVLCVESWDRISRLPMVKAVTLFMNIINSGIGMVFTMTHGKTLITEKTLNAEPYLIYSVIGEAQRAHQESKVKSERVADACNRRKQNAKDLGIKVFAWTPPWCDYDHDKKLYTVDESKAAIVKRIFNEYLNGNGPFRICRKFNQETVPVLGHKGFKVYKNTTKEWYKKSVREFLRDKRVYGYAHHIDAENYYPAIISKDLFNKVQNRLALQAASEPTGGRIEKVSNLFTSICRCSKCHSVMDKVSTTKTYKSKKTKYEYLVCDGARTGKGCSYESVPYQWVESTFLTLLDTPKFYTAVSDKQHDNSNKDRLAVLSGELAVTEQNIKKFADTFEKYPNPPLTLVERLDKAEVRRGELKKQIRLLEAAADNESQSADDIELRNELKNHLTGKMTNPDFRLKVREFIRRFIKIITIDTQSDFLNYQVTFKNGAVSSVVMWPKGKEVSKGVLFQMFSGVKRVYDAKGLTFNS